LSGGGTVSISAPWRGGGAILPPARTGMTVCLVGLITRKGMDRGDFQSVCSDLFHLRSIPPADFTGDFDLPFLDKEVKAFLYCLFADATGGSDGVGVVLLRLGGKDAQNGLK
jgi:hypothetical protein